jgi:hypothetical protein
VSIHVRPPEVDDRVMPGHWEGDFIKGAGNQSSVGVLVERTSRLVLLAKMEDATAASALAGFTAKLNSIAAPLRQTFTYDQGKEMTRHQELSAATGVRVYFCDPHSPWQRGTCENTNGLLRQYLPKGTDLSIYSQDELDAIADSLNSRPRATHAFHSPFEVFERMLATPCCASLLKPPSLSMNDYARAYALVRPLRGADRKLDNREPRKYASKHSECVPSALSNEPKGRTNAFGTDVLRARNRAPRPESALCPLHSLETEYVAPRRSEQRFRGRRRINTDRYCSARDLFG